MSAALVLGVGLSSKATAEELMTLIDAALGSIGASRADVVRVATRESLATDGRIAAVVAAPIATVADGDLINESSLVMRPFGIPARVARTAALAGRRHLVGSASENDIVIELKSAHATIAIASVGYSQEQNR